MILNMDSLKTFLSLFATGSLAGFIDSMVGGGALITMPVLSIIFGPGIEAIGTNKIAGASSALVALLVYSRRQKIDLHKSLSFVVWISIGALIGSSLTSYIPAFIFKYFLLVTCPCILWIVYKKEVWAKKEIKELNPVKKELWKTLFDYKILFSGFFCGIYDGLWGPGAGVFMFLSLLFFANLPLFEALAISKLANSFAAGVALTNYAFQGCVHWPEGIVLALGMSGGAFIGSSYAQKKMEKVIRPLLVVVAGLLLCRVFFS